MLEVKWGIDSIHVATEVNRSTGSDAVNRNNRIDGYQQIISYKQSQVKNVTLIISLFYFKTHTTQSIIEKWKVKLITNFKFSSSILLSIYEVNFFRYVKVS